MKLQWHPAAGQGGHAAGSFPQSCFKSLLRPTLLLPPPYFQNTIPLLFFQEIIFCPSSSRNRLLAPYRSSWSFHTRRVNSCDKLSRNSKPRKRLRRAGKMAEGPSLHRMPEVATMVETVWLPGPTGMTRVTAPQGWRKGIHSGWRAIPLDHIEPFKELLTSTTAYRQARGQYVDGMNGRFNAVFVVEDSCRDPSETCTPHILTLVMKNNAQSNWSLKLKDARAALHRAWGPSSNACADTRAITYEMEQSNTFPGLPGLVAWYNRTAVMLETESVAWKPAKYCFDDLLVEIGQRAGITVYIYAMALGGPKTHMNLINGI